MYDIINMRVSHVFAMFYSVAKVLPTTVQNYYVTKSW